MQLRACSHDITILASHRFELRYDNVALFVSWGDAHDIVALLILDCVSVRFQSIIIHVGTCGDSQTNGPLTRVPVASVLMR